LTGGDIFGIVVAVVIVLGGIAAVVYFFKFRKHSIRYSAVSAIHEEEYS
jgi:hypothetical protein